MPMLWEDMNEDEMLDALRWQESRGRSDLVSPKGAAGPYQWMKKTWEDPGMGVPAKAGGTWQNFLANEQLQRDQTKKYLKAQYDRTGSVEGALAGYNGGLRAGLRYKNGQSIPAETAKYIPAVLDHYKTGVGKTKTTAMRSKFDDFWRQVNPLAVPAALAAEGDPADPLNHPSITPTMAGPKRLDRLDPTAPYAAPVPGVEGGPGLEEPAAPAPAQPPAPDAALPQLPPPEGSVNPFNDPSQPVPDELTEAGSPVGDATPEQGDGGGADPIAAGIDPEVAKYFESLRPKKNPWTALAAAGMQIGGGLMESGGMKGMGAAGIAAGNSLTEGQLLKLKEAEIEGASMPIMMRYQRNIEGGMNSRDAFLDAVSNKDERVSPGFRRKADGTWEPTKGGPHDVDVIKEEADVRAKAQADALNGNSDVKSIVAGIRKGVLPPTTTGMYKYGVPVKAALADSGFDLAGATLEYKAAEQQMRTLNSPRMTSFVGLARSVLGTMDEVKKLSKEMNNIGITGYNTAKLQLLVHTQGNTPQGKLATKYLAAVGTLKGEFANLENGGYAPTEDAWKIANQQIKSEFGVDQMAASIDELQRLINYRLTAIPGLLDRGPGGANRYTKQEQVDITKHHDNTQPLEDHATPPSGMSPEDEALWQAGDEAQRRELEELYDLNGYDQ